MADFLRESRKELDNIDYDLIKVLKKRLIVVKNIKKYKKENGINIHDREREKDLLQDRKSYAKNINISEDFIENIFLNLLDFVKKD